MMIVRLLTGMLSLFSLALLLGPVRAAPPEVAPTTVVASATSTLAGRIHLAGRQRMLTQRMTKSMCYAMLGLQEEAHAKRAERAATEFIAVLSSLRKAPFFRVDPDQKEPGVAQLLTDVAEISGGLTASVRQIAAGDVHARAVRLVLERNLPVLERMDKAIKEMTSKAGLALPAKTARTLNEAGRQRMLSQRMVKNVCFIAADLENIKHRVALRHDVSYFKSVHAALMVRSGKSHFDIPPTGTIRQALRAVDTAWAQLSPVLDDVISGKRPTRQTLLEIEVLAEEILIQMNQAVVLWARHHS